MKNFYFRSVILVFIMVGITSMLGCSMYPAITPVAQVQPVAQDEHNIAKNEVEEVNTVQLDGTLNGQVEKNTEVTKVSDTNVTEKPVGIHIPTKSDKELEVDFEKIPIENIEDLHETTDSNHSTEQTSSVNEEQPEVDVKQIAITFDDGPDLKYTPQVLDILNEKDIKATFFIVGIQIKKYPEVVQRMVDEGHLIANHTYHHPNLKSLKKDEILNELDTTDALIESIVGFKPTIVRPPYGSINKEIRELIHETGREVVLWNIDPRDWDNTPVDEMYNNIMSNARSEGNILFHSFGGKRIQNTVDLLPKIIDALKNEGYTFVTADKLIK